MTALAACRASQSAVRWLPPQGSRCPPLQYKNRCMMGTKRRQPTFIEMVHRLRTQQPNLGLVEIADRIIAEVVEGSREVDSKANACRPRHSADPQRIARRAIRRLFHENPRANSRQILALLDQENIPATPEFVEQTLNLYRRHRRGPVASRREVQAAVNSGHVARPAKPALAPAPRAPKRRDVSCEELLLARRMVEAGGCIEKARAALALLKELK